MKTKRVAKRGNSVVSFLIAVILGLALIAIVIMIYQKFIIGEYVPVLTQVTSWNEALGNAVPGQGECLHDSKCEGRQGWTRVLKSDILCPKEAPYACLLTPQKWRDYFTPGSLVLNDGDRDYKLPDTKENKNGVGFPMTKKQEFALYYVPHDALDKYADETCTFSINDNNVKTVKDCYKAGEGEHGWVLIWKGTTAEFQKKYASPQRKYTLKMTASRKGFDKETARTYILNVART